MRWRRIAMVGATTYVVALIVLVFVHSRTAPHPPFPRGHAVTGALHDRDVRSFLRAAGWTRARVIALDREQWRVTFMNGSRLVLDAAVDPRGRVTATEQHLPGTHPPGSKILWSKPMLLLLLLVFALVTSVRPLRRVRNLDVLVSAAGFGAAMLLLNARMPAAEAYVGAAALAYLAVRCAQVGLTRGAPAAATPLLAARGVPVLVAGGLLVAGLLITLTSTGISDVAFAGLAGATELNHGVLPYGQPIVGVVHGDTYPLLTYILYMPFAALVPVHNGFDSMDGALDLNAIALVLSTALVFILGLRLARGDRPRAAALCAAWLAFPPVLVAASGGGNDVPTAVFVVAALVWFARAPTRTGLMSAAAWVKIVPLAALVVWLPASRGRALVRSCLVLAVAAAIGAVVIVAVDGRHGLSDMFRALGFQLDRGSWYSLWAHVGGWRAQVAFQAGIAAAAVVVAVMERHRPAGALSFRRMAALAASLMLLLQIAASYWTFAYLPWVMPLVLVALLPPVPRRSPPPAPRAP